MSPSLVFLFLVLIAPQQGPAKDPNVPEEASVPRRSLGFKVFNNMDRPLAGLWELEIPDGAPLRIEIREADPGNPGAFAGVDPASGEEVLRLTRKKEGVGYEGHLKKVFLACGFDTLAISEFLPLGDAVVMKFETTPPSSPCPPIDGGRAGRFYALSTRGGPVRLRPFSEISSSSVRETYSIGGDRPNTEITREFPLGAVSVDDGAELRLLRRVKAPLDGTFWFEVEALVSPEVGVEAPRGFVKGESIRFVASLTLKRLK